MEPKGSCTFRHSGHSDLRLCTFPFSSPEEESGREAPWGIGELDGADAICLWESEDRNFRPLLEEHCFKTMEEGSSVKA